MAARAGQSAADKAARMRAAREAGQAILPPTSAAPDGASTGRDEISATALTQHEEGGVMVRLSVDLAQALYDQLDDWMRTAARASGRTRFHRVLVMRALIRELLADAALAERVRRRVQDDMRRGT